MTLTILNCGGHFLTAALRSLGHRVFSVGLGSGHDLSVEHPLAARALLTRLADAGATPDVALYTDNGNLPFLVDAETLPFPSVFYSVDTFCNPWHLPFGAGFDLVLAAQKDHVPLFRREGYDCRWFPLFFVRPPLPPADRDAFARRDVPVAFVGTLRPRNIPDRLPFLERFRHVHPLVYREGDYAPLFLRARIVLNQTAASEVNFRCFEAMAHGAALLMESCGHGLTDLFAPGENVLPTYPRGDARAAAAIAADWLARPEALASVALAGQRLVLEHHLAVHRATELVGLLEGLLAARSHVRRLAELPRRRRLVATAYAIIAAELNAPEMRPHRDFFVALHAAARHEAGASPRKAPHGNAPFPTPEVPD